MYAAQAVGGVRIIDATGKFVMPGTFSTSILSSYFSCSLIETLNLHPTPESIELQILRIPYENQNASWISLSSLMQLVGYLTCN